MFESYTDRLTYVCLQAETFHEKPWFKTAKDVHGYDGPLHIEPHDLAPISDLIKESMIDQGLPLDHDMFTTGETPHGCGHCPRTVYKGIRSTGADFITNDYARKNITILPNSTVDRVLLETGSEGIKATGVAVVRTLDGTKSEFKARKEVIISAGSYCSPAILLRSGIGAKEEVEKHGIESIIDLPGVGKNLMDHLVSLLPIYTYMDILTIKKKIVFIFYETDKPNITNDHLVYHGTAFADSYKLWKEQKTGFLSTFPFGIFAFARLDDRLANEPLWNSAPREPGRDPMGLTPKQPNIEFFTTECYGGPKQFDKFPGDNQHAFSIIAELFAPKSRGSVTLKDKDPLQNPVVDCNYLAHPLDVLVLSEACRFANEIVMKGKGTKDIVKGSWPADLSHHTYTTREEWVPYVKQNATTCKFHPPSQPWCPNDLHD